MKQPRRSSSNRRRPAGSTRSVPTDIWRATPPLPPVEPIAIPDEVGAVLRSLGDPPPIGGSTAAGHYFTAVAERAAAIAAALALTGGVLAPLDER